MPLLGTLHIMIIADRNAMRSSLCCQLAALLHQYGLSTDQYRFHTMRTVEDGLAHIFGNPPFKMDLIVCWDTQPARVHKIHGRPACARRDREGYRMVDVLSHFTDLRVPVIYVPAEPEAIGLDPDPTTSIGGMRDPFPEAGWFQREDTDVIPFVKSDDPTSRAHGQGCPLEVIAGMVNLIHPRAA